MEGLKDPSARKIQEGGSSQHQMFSVYSVYIQKGALIPRGSSQLSEWWEDLALRQEDLSARDKPDNDGGGLFSG